MLGKTIKRIVSSRTQMAKIAKKGGAKFAKAIEEVGNTTSSQSDGKSVQRFLPKDIEGVPVLIPELGATNEGGTLHAADSKTWHCLGGLAIPQTSLHPRGLPSLDPCSGFASWSVICTVISCVIILNIVVSRTTII